MSAALMARPRFEQGLDAARPHELLTVNCKSSGSLTYRYSDTGEVVEVPNVPYNQPASIRVDFLQWQADRIEAHAEQARKGSPFGGSMRKAEETAKSMLELARSMRSTAAEMVRTNRATHPVAASR